MLPPLLKMLRNQDFQTNPRGKRHTPQTQLTRPTPKTQRGVGKSRRHYRDRFLQFAMKPTSPSPIQAATGLALPQASENLSLVGASRSEERRVGKECRARWSRKN